jgi:hypothetical protein
MLIKPLDESNLLSSVTDEPVIYQLQEPYVSLPPKVTNFFPVRSQGDDSCSININLIGGSAGGVNNNKTLNCSNIAILDDLCNFGFTVKVLDINTSLTRKSRTTFTDELSTVALNLINYDLGWQLIVSNPYTIHYNNRQVPIGSFSSGTQTLSVVYTNE